MQSRKPSVRIVEQPTSKYRFRYESEKERGSISKLTGKSGSSFVPSIEIKGCTGEVLIIISCVTQHKPYSPHPYSVVDQSKVKQADFVNKGFYCQRTELSNDRTVVQFRNIGIICTTKRKIKDMLIFRKAYNIDPFNTGFNDFRLRSEGKASPALRLCFQVFLMEANEVRLPLKPVVSDVIKDNRTLIIDHVSHDSGPAYRPTLITIVCNMVPKNDFEVVFFEENNENFQWESIAQVSAVFRENSIVCYTPLYKDLFASKQVFIKLKRKSDGMCSNFVKFVYTNSKTASKTLSKLLSSSLKQSYSTAQTMYSYQQQLSGPLPAFLNQDKDQVNNQIQNRQVTHLKSLKLPEQNVIRDMSSLPHYMDSGPSTSRMVYISPDNANSEGPGMGDIISNRHADAERKSYGKKYAKSAPCLFKANGSTERGLLRDVNTQVQTQEMILPGSPQELLPSFESLKDSQWQQQFTNTLEKQQQLEESQNVEPIYIPSDLGNTSHSVIENISPSKNPTPCNTKCTKFNPVDPVAESSNSRSCSCNDKSDMDDIVTAFENVLSETGSMSFEDFSMDKEDFCMNLFKCK